jgi:putative membrane protein
VSRRLALAAGFVALGVAWLAPWRAVWGGPFAAHMTAHMAIVVVAAPLLALALAGGGCDPVRRWTWLGAAIPASLVDLAVVSVWHAPALHAAARHQAVALVVEQAAFLAAGLWFWLAVFGGSPEERAARAGTSVVALVLTFAHMTLLGALLSLSSRPLYAHAHDATTRLAPLADQQLGGSIMLVFGGVYIAAGLWLGAGLVRRPAPVAVRS